MTNNIEIIHALRQYKGHEIERAIGVLIGLGKADLAERLERNAGDLDYYQRRYHEQVKTAPTLADTDGPADCIFARSITTAEHPYEAIERERPEIHAEYRAIVAEIDALIEEYDNALTTAERESQVIS